jgi:hypothetical protein
MSLWQRFCFRGFTDYVHEDQQRDFGAAVLWDLRRDATSGVRLPAWILNQLVNVLFSANFLI